MEAVVLSLLHQDKLICWLVWLGFFFFSHCKKNSQQNSGAGYLLNEIKLCLALWKSMEALPLTWQMSHLLRMEERDVPTLMEGDLLAMVWKPFE